MPDPTGTQCQCGQCGQVFATLSLFDAHQDVDYRRPHAQVVRCRDGAEIRVNARSEVVRGGPLPLVLVNGVWYTEGGVRARARRLAVLRAAQADSKRPQGGAGTAVPADGHKARSVPLGAV